MLSFHKQSAVSSGTEHQSCGHQQLGKKNLPSEHAAKTNIGLLQVKTWSKTDAGGDKKMTRALMEVG